MSFRWFFSRGSKKAAINGNDIDEILRISAPFWLPSALLSAAAVSWWVMLEMKIPRRGVWWLAMMAIGASLAATMSRSF
jgi:hypothetical protein